VEVKGSGSTGTTYTFITKNSNNDTSVVIKDNGRIGIGTKTPAFKAEINGSLLLDTLRFSDGTYQVTSSRYARVFVVATSGGDFQDVQTALANCLNPSPTNQYMILVMPGNYANPAPVQCKKYVTLRGSGKYSTTINARIIGADSCVIEDFYLGQGVTCNATSPTIWHNVITDTTTDNANGIEIFNGARPLIKENEILDCNGFGINCVTTPGGPDSEAWIIANKIFRNEGGGIRLENSSPLISNNFINHNNHFGIWMMGADGTPTEPTIDDNVIGHTDYQSGGIGIFMAGRAEPRIIANDIYLNETGIEIHPNTQPSVLSNNFNYNWDAGIRTFSNGAGKPVVIQGNHIHSSARGTQPAGIWIGNMSTPIIAHNIVTDNDPAGINPDIDYTTNFPATPILNLNVYDIIVRPAAIPVGTGSFNANSLGAPINP
jgi:hypothetical protein